MLPSLEVSFRISPSPSRLHEFLVRMDTTNRTSSENFQVQQLSCVGDQWELAPLQPIGSDLSLGFLMAGQSLSCFFRLKVSRKVMSLAHLICGCHFSFSRDSSHVLIVLKKTYHRHP